MSCETCKNHATPTERLIEDAQEQHRRDREKTKRTFIICTTICVLFAMFMFLISGIEVTTTKEESRIVQETSGEGDAVFQSGENARFYAEWGD